MPEYEIDNPPEMIRRIGIAIEEKNGYRFWLIELNQPIHLQKGEKIIVRLEEIGNSRL